MTLQRCALSAVSMPASAVVSATGQTLGFRVSDSVHPIRASRSRLMVRCMRPAPRKPHAATGDRNHGNLGFCLVIDLFGSRTGVVRENSPGHASAVDVCFRYWLGV